MPNRQTATRVSRTTGAFSEGELDFLLAPQDCRKPITDASSNPARPGLQHLQLVAPNPPAAGPVTRNDIFRTYHAYQQSIRLAGEAQAETERSLFGFAVSTTPGTLDILELATQVIDLMIYEAKKKFQNRYITLDIDRGEVLRNTGNERWRSNYEEARRSNHSRRRNSVPVPLPEVPVDLDAIWTYLETSYGGEAGERSLHRQLAPMLVKRLHLDGDTIKRTASAVIAWVRIRSEPARWGSKTGPYKLYDRKELNEVFDALSRAFGWLGMQDLSDALAPDSHKIGDFNFTFEPREKFAFPGVEVVAFKDGFDFKFGHDVAAKLQLYLGEFTA